MWMADPHVISALRSKRAELSGELIAAEARIIQLRSDIASLDGAIRVFDPTATPDKIPILRRKKPTLIPRGQCGRAILDLLRHAQDAMTARHLVARISWAERLGLGSVEDHSPFGERDFAGRWSRLLSPQASTGGKSG